MESPSPSLRRQAWVQTSRQWQTLEENDLRAPSPPPPPPPPPSSFSTERQHSADECCSIESWLLRCGRQLPPEGLGHLPTEPGLRSCSFEDDLSLGAEAPMFGVENEELGAGSCPLLLPPPKTRHKGPSTSTPGEKLRFPQLSLGHSMASSGLSSSTSRTASSVSEVLQLCSEDAEDTLYQLGFGSEVPQPSARIPPRFLSFPSRLGGISFRLFLQAQLLRLRQEDPDLSLASRFRQVEVLTAMANAFSSLYSHVSRTPIQKLAPPDLSLSSPSADKKTARFLSSVRSEPRSPVDRLKDTVSRMCLYTGSSRGSESGTPLSSPKKRASLPNLVDLVMENASKWAGQEDQGSRVEDQSSGVEDQSSGGRGEDQSSGVEVQSSGVEDQSSRGRVENQSSGVEDQGSGGRVEDQSSGVEDQSSGVENQCSGGRVEDQSSGVEEQSSGVEDQSSGGSLRVCDLQQLTYPTGLGPVAMVTHDFTHLPIAEHVHMAPFYCPTPQISPTSQRDLGVMPSCCITVTGWEGDNVTSCFTPGSLEEVCLSDGRGTVEMLKTGTLVPSSTLQQANSFELEEVVVAGEDKAEQEGPRMMSLLGSSGLQLKGVVGRGDSVQSDSSGYAEEDVGCPDS